MTNTAAEVSTFNYEISGLPEMGEVEQAEVEHALGDILKSSEYIIELGHLSEADLDNLSEEDLEALKEEYKVELTISH